MRALFPFFRLWHRAGLEGFNRTDPPKYFKTTRYLIDENKLREFFCVGDKVPQRNSIGGQNLKD